MISIRFIVYDYWRPPSNRLEHVREGVFGPRGPISQSRLSAMNPEAIDTDIRPFVLIWELTQACDLECEHCRADAQPERHPGELTTREGKELLREASRFGDDQLVVLSGGDPLVREDVVDLVQFGTDLGLRMTMTPSGTDSLDADAIGALEEAGLKRMAVSIDGATAESHDTFRGQAGSFETTVEAARLARDAGLPLQVNTTVSASTVEDLPAIRDLVADLGAVLWSVFFLVPLGRGRILDPISPERAESVMEWLVDVTDDAPFGVKTTEAPHFRRVALQSRHPDAGTASPAVDQIGRRTGVRAGDGFVFVSHVGEVFPSGFLPLSAGSVREQSIVDIYRDSDLFTRLRDTEELQGKCGACEFNQVCGGSRSRAFAYTGDPLASDPLCAYVPSGYDGPLPTQELPDEPLP